MLAQQLGRRAANLKFSVMTDKIMLSSRHLEKLEILDWKFHETAVIIIDMWDKTICKARSVER
jgi:hypothetical protein